MRIFVALLAAFVAWSLTSGIMILLGMHGLAALVGLITGVATFFLVKGALKANALSTPVLPPGFSGNFHHDNIAIDTKSNRVWLRDRKSGQATIFEKSDLLRWTHRYTTGNQGTWVKNFIDVEVRDLNRPKYEVAFVRNGEFTIFGARKNQAECEEWQSRLTTWINN